MGRLPRRRMLSSKVISTFARSEPPEQKKESDVDAFRLRQRSPLRIGVSEEVLSRSEQDDMNYSEPARVHEWDAYIFVNKYF
jgi:hypothetical protein